MAATRALSFATAARLLRRQQRWPRLAVVALALAGLAYGVFDGTMHYHSRTLAGEWWQCLISRAPPQVRDDLPNRFPVAPEERAAADVAADPAPGINARDVVGRSPAAVYSGKFGYEDITVAIVDSGIASGSIGRALVQGLDTVNPCGDGTSDANGHGTAVAGIITSPRHGAAAGVRILPVRTSLATGVQLRWANAAAVVWATNRGADVINLSTSSQSSSPSLIERAAIRYATTRGVVIVAAAGNDRSRPASYPAGYPEVISVTSVDGAGDLSWFAARRGRIDVAAPGSRIQTVGVDGALRIVSGTSFAAPFVTATVARMLAVNPRLRPAEVQTILRATATPLPDDAAAPPHVGFGLVNVDAALKAAGVDLPDVALARLPRPPEPLQLATGSPLPGGPLP